jgi:hypothetical protein
MIQPFGGEGTHGANLEREKPERVNLDVFLQPTFCLLLFSAEFNLWIEKCK